MLWKYPFTTRISSLIHNNYRKFFQPLIWEMYVWNVAGRAPRDFLPATSILWLACDVRGIEGPTQDVPRSGSTANMQQEHGELAAGRARVLAFDPELADDPPACRQPREVLQRARVLPEAAWVAFETRAADEGEGWRRRGKRHPRFRMWRGRRFRRYGRRREHRGPPEGTLRQSAFPLRTGERGTWKQSYRMISGDNRSLKSKLEKIDEVVSQSCALVLKLRHLRKINRLDFRKVR